jgi:hypothetical protein
MGVVTPPVNLDAFILQNPVEDIWLNAKTWVRKFGNRLRSFSLVKWFFNFTMQQQIFGFPKLHKFGNFEPNFS